MPLVVTPDQCQARQTARQEIVRQVELGATASEAQRRCPIPMHRTTVYRLLKRVEREGQHAFVERRHGHPTKLRGEVLTFVLDYCQNHASAASREVQRLVAERFSLCVSVSQLNRVRAAHELSRKNPPGEKKAENGRHHCLWISRTGWCLAPVSSSQRDRPDHAIGAGFATSSRPSVSSPGRQCSSPPTPAAHAPVSGSGRFTAHLGSARLYRRRLGTPYRANACLWVSLLHRSLFVARRPLRWS